METESTHTPTDRPSSARLHVAAGISTALVVGGAVAALSARRASRHPSLPRTALWGTGAAFTAGVTKEAADAMGFGTPTALDVLLTTAGGIVGSAKLAILLAHSGSPQDAITTAGGSVGAGIVLALPVGRELVRRLTR